MRRRRAVVLLAVLGVLVGACAPGEPTGTTSSPETTIEEPPGTSVAETTTTEGSTDTTGPPTGTDLSEFEFAPSHACFFSAHHLFIPEGEGDAAVAILTNAEITAVNGYIPDPVEDIELGGPPVATGLDGAVDIVTIADGSPNALLVSELLRSNEILARPVHMIGMTGHWQVKPGNDPVEVEESLLQPGDPPNGSSAIAVVDTAVVENSYGWVLDGVVADTIVGTDPHDLGASHGTFIASLIRQVAPDVTVAFASLPAADKGLYFQSWPEGEIGSFVTNNVTSEIPAYQAVLDLIPRLTNDGIQPSALSLSWGTYPCDSQFPDDFSAENEMAALAETLGQWQSAFPDAPVFAAAGNEPPNHGPFFPAAFADVVGVAADGGNGQALVWDDATAVYVTLPWADIYAPGCDLVGVSGVQQPGPVVAWGGSSFATPLAALTWMESGLPPSGATTMQTSDMLAGPSADEGRC